jgi:hypothetical protein
MVLFAEIGEAVMEWQSTNLKVPHYYSFCSSYLVDLQQ